LTSAAKQAAIAGASCNVTLCYKLKAFMKVSCDNLVSLSVEQYRQLSQELAAIDFADLNITETAV